MGDFDEAREASAEMFEQQPPESEGYQEELPLEGNDGGEAPSETAQEAEGEQERISESVQEVPQETGESEQLRAQLTAMQQQMQGMQQQNEQLQGMVRELSQQNEQRVVNDAIEMPEIDIGGLAFADQDTINNAQADYARRMAEYTRQIVMRDLQPFVDEAKQGRALRQRQAAVEGLKQLPELADIDDMMPQIEQIISSNRALAAEDIPIDEKIITAYAIARGVNAMNTPAPKEPTTEELMAIYNRNADFQNAIEQQRLAALKKQSQQVPLFSASSGAVNAALNIKDKPKTFDEALALTRERFGD